MSFDISRISGQVNAFWSDYGYALIAGRYVWVLATITASIVALNASSLVEALLRFTLPLAAAGLWWVGITAEREEDSEEVKQRRGEERARREAVWAISLRRLLVAVGVMRPGTQTITEAERERRIRLMVIAADRFHAAKPGTWRARRALLRLRRLARLASANDIATVRARLARTTRIAQLVIPNDDPPVGTSEPASVHLSGHSPAPATTAARNGDVRETVADAPSATAALHLDAAESVPGNGTVPPRNMDGAATAGSRAPAERVYRDSVRAGQPLSTREVARKAGCSTTTAWRGIRAFQTYSPSDARADAEAFVV